MAPRRTSAESQRILRALDLRSDRLAGQVLDQLTLPRIRRTQCLIVEISFQNTDLSDSTFTGVTLDTVDFSDATLVRSNLRGSSCTAVTFARANLQQADLRGCTFTRCDLTDAQMAGTKLSPDQAAQLTLAEAQQSEIDWQAAGADNLIASGKVAGPKERGKVPYIALPDGQVIDAEWMILTVSRGPGWGTDDLIWWMLSLEGQRFLLFTRDLDDPSDEAKNALVVGQRAIPEFLSSRIISNKSPSVTAVSAENDLLTVDFSLSTSHQFGSVRSKDQLTIDLAQMTIHHTATYKTRLDRD